MLMSAQQPRHELPELSGRSASLPARNGAGWQVPVWPRWRIDDYRKARISLRPDPRWAGYWRGKLRLRKAQMLVVSRLFVPEKLRILENASHDLGPRRYHSVTPGPRIKREALTFSPAPAGKAGV